MTLSEFKTFCEIKTLGGKTLPKDNAGYKVLIQESLNFIATKIVPVDLTTQDLSQPTLRYLDLTTKIRKPIAPINDGDIIDIDEQLTYAVLYNFLIGYAESPLDFSNFTTIRDEIITTYTMNNYKLLKEIIFVLIELKK